MPSYRLYHIDQHRFVGTDAFEASDDDQAIRDARLLNRTAASELWEGGRKITTPRTGQESPVVPDASTEALSADFQLPA